MPGIPISSEKPLPDPGFLIDANTLDIDDGVADDEGEPEDEEAHDSFNESGYPIQNDMLTSSISTSANKSNYEVAVKEIEQEKQMVAALKRLSIGHMMTYDPDLPMDDLEYQYQFQQQQQQQQQQNSEDLSTKRFSTSSPSTSPTRSPRSKSGSTSPVNETKLTPSISKSNSPSRTHSLSRHPSVTRTASITRHNSISRKNSMKAVPHTRTSSRNSMESNEEFFDAQSADEFLDTNSLLWVPANLHPEVEPEQFKKHIKHQVEEILERKLSKSNHRSKRSSLASTTLPESSSSEDLTHILDASNVDHSTVSEEESSNTSTKKLSPERASLPEKRFSNPSLRDLTNELETLSKLAGMDSSDALTLARTLSSASLGFTDVEKQAIVELNHSPPHSTTSTSPRKNEGSTDTLYDPESPTARKTIGFESPNYGGSPSRNNSVSGGQSPQKSYRHLQHQLAKSFEQSQRNNSSHQPVGYQQQQQSQNPNYHNNHTYNRHRDHEPQHVHQKQGPLNLHAPPNSSSQSSEIPLKRSRRLDYRKQHSGSNPTLGSQLQNNKAGKLAELRNNLNSGVSIITQEPQVKPKLKLKNKSSNLPPHPRSSQMLFSYRNPTDPPSSDSSKDSPYHGTSSSRSPFDKMNGMKYNHSRQMKPKSPTSPIDHLNPLVSQDEHSRMVAGSRRLNDTSYRSKGLPEMPHSNSPYGRQPDSSSPSRSKVRPSDPRKEPQKTLHQPYVTTPGTDPYEPLSKDDKSKQLNQNLDLLRSEINEFKESLSKSDPSVQPDPYPVSSYRSPTSRDYGISDAESPGSANESDFSFEATCQDISYEDSLGLDQDVLRELNDEAEIQKQKDLKAELKRKFEVSMRANEKEETDEQPLTPSFIETTDNIDRAMEREQLLNKDHNEQRTDLNQNEFQNRHYNPEFRSQRQNAMQNARRQDYYQEVIPEIPIVHKDATPQYLQERDITMNESLPLENDFVSLSSDADISPKKQRSPQIVQPNVDRSNQQLPKPTIKKTVKKKKSWPWLKEKERSASMSSLKSSNLPTVPDNVKLSSPTRSVSTPEISNQAKPSAVDVFEPEHQVVKDRKESAGKDNVIAKFFKRKRSGSSSTNANAQKKSDEVNRDFNSSILSKSSNESGVAVDYESDSDSHYGAKKKSGGIFKLKQKHLEKDDKISAIVKSVSLSSLRSEDDAHGTIPLDHEGIRERKALDITHPETNEYDQTSLLSITVDELQQHQTELSQNSEKSEDQMIDIVLEETKEIKKDKKKSRLKRAKEEREAEKKRVEEEHKGRKERKDHSKEKNSSKQMKPQEVEAEEGSDDKMVVEEGQKSLQSTLEVQEKLKKSIKRTSRANQPIEFTDSAFGFPLPPPSQSTLVMLDYRFPVHVERAIYRLSHLKLANPKRSLREQVLLSNFMYAYLNLVDHTLHLEQQMNNGTDDQPGDQANDQFGTGSTFGDDIMINETDEIYEEDADRDILDIKQESIAIDLDIADDKV